MHRILWPILILLASIPLAIHADTELELDRDTVERWVASMEAFQEWSDGQREEAAGAEGEEPDLATVMAEATRRQEEMEEILRDHGFNDMDDWHRTGSRISDAWFILQVEESAPEREQQLEEALGQIDENPYLDEEQRRTLREQIVQAHSALDERHADLPPGDLEAVRAARPALERFFGNR